MCLHIIGHGQIRIRELFNNLRVNASGQSHTSTAAPMTSGQSHIQSYEAQGHPSSQVQATTSPIPPADEHPSRNNPIFRL